MMPRLSLLPLAALLLAAPAALAQTTPTPAYDLSATHRYVQPTQLWPQLQGELRLGGGDYLLLSVQGRRFLGDTYVANRSLGFDARQALVGYEHFAGEHWSFGGAARLVGTSGPVAFIPEVLLRHRSPIFGGLTLGQRLSLERTFSSGSTQALESGPDGQTWGRLRVDLERLLVLRGDEFVGLALRPRLSYEAATHLRLQKADTDPDERTIQYTSLRAELGLRLSRRLDLTPWFAYQTQYLETLPQYNAQGNPTAGGKINAVYPTFGLDLRITLLPGGAADNSRQPLPTQH